MNGFRGIKKYQDFCRKDVMEKGFISLNPKVGYKAYIYDFNYLCKIGLNSQNLDSGITTEK